MPNAARPIAANARALPQHQLSLISMPSQTTLAGPFKYGNAVVYPARCVFAGSLNANNPKSETQDGPQVVFVTHGAAEHTEALEAIVQNGSKALVLDPQIHNQLVSGLAIAFLVQTPVAAAVAVALLRQVLQGQITMEECMEKLAPHIIQSS